MKILAIDAATEGCSVALLVDGKVTAKYEFAPQRHSQILLPMVDDILKSANLTLAQLDCIAYGQGPGSFTGVRIGVSIAQGLAFSADIKVIGISSLATMAQQVIAEQSAPFVLAAIDARMGEVYFGLYQNVGGLATLVETEGVYKPCDLPNFELDGAYSAGSGWQTYESEVVAKFSVTTSKVEFPSAEFMLPIAAAQFSQGLGGTAEKAQPNYVRDEVTWKKLPGR
jgi:tRNA threonylcarbamoyladenosine biosynthesis protein TsaB